MPIPKSFENRLLPHLREIVAHFGTPFHIYDEAGILDTGEQLKAAFADCHGFKEYFAVKANPNPEILKLMFQSGFGFDCSSMPELILARQVGAKPNDIMFTSNNTSSVEFQEAMKDGGCILNLDDVTLIDKVPRDFPELICFRYNPGPKRTGNAIIGNPVEAKYGVSNDQIVSAYTEARKRGATRFGLHTMVASNERKMGYLAGTVKMLLEVAHLVKKESGIEFEFLNMGGGIGVPYRPTHKPVDIFSLGHKVAIMLRNFSNSAGYMPKLFMENGRYLTAHHGVLVTTCINQKHIYREYRGVDACMSSLMRPAMYGLSPHHCSWRERKKDGSSRRSRLALRKQ
jgi:diaminopimelate decarboxylase